MDDGLTPELRRSVRICGLTDLIRDTLEAQERDYSNAGMFTDNKDRAERVVRLLIERTEEVR